MRYTGTQAIATFKKIYKGKNLVTPYVIEYWIDGDYLAEISFGRFMGNKIFGLTIADWHHQEKMAEYNTAEYSLPELRQRWEEFLAKHQEK